MKSLLWFCVALGVACAVAWALGWEYAAFGILIAMGISAFPLFHFAMDWPLRDGKQKRK